MHGTITPAGVYTADTVPGDYSIVAKDATGRRAGARVRLLHRVAELVLTPAIAAVSTGGTVQFHVFGRTFAGESVAAVATWSATGTCQPPQVMPGSKVMPPNPGPYPPPNRQRT